jgi:hypothetical protein
VLVRSEFKKGEGQEKKELDKTTLCKLSQPHEESRGQEESLVRRKVASGVGVGREGR